MAASLPRTAAAMLDLDRAQRTRSPLDPVLRAKMRWVIAHANRCAYSEAYALADLTRAGGDEAAVKALTGDPSGWPEADREPLEFARLLHRSPPRRSATNCSSGSASGSATRRVAAMVLLAAYGNFQDRVVLGLEPARSRPAAPCRRSRSTFAPGRSSPCRSCPRSRELPGCSRRARRSSNATRNGRELTYEELQSRLEGQRARTPRLPVPTWDEVKKKLPPAFAARPTRIVWNLVCSGYVPELAVPWSVVDADDVGRGEARPRLRGEPVLGPDPQHPLQLLHGPLRDAAGGRGPRQGRVAERTRRLAGDDWSCFPPAEQRAYAYARKLTKTPWELTAADYKSLESDLGPEKAMATFWWLCRGLYMTRVSDGFQFPLERDNVFREFFNPKNAEPAREAVKH